jgi:hypothetical protein
MGSYSIVSLETGGTLEVPDFSNGQAGTQVHVSQPNNTPNEKWKIESINGGFAIKSTANGLALNAFGGGCNQGDKVGLWKFENGNNDTWTILPA